MFEFTKCTEADFFLAADRLSDFYISVGNQFNPSDTSCFPPTFFSLCHYQKDAFPGGQTRTFYCVGAPIGRYVAIYFPISKSMHLTLCEVEVFGHIHMEPSGKWLGLPNCP